MIRGSGASREGARRFNGDPWRVSTVCLLAPRRSEPHVLVVRGIEPEHPFEDAVGFLEPAEPPQAETEPAHAAVSPAAIRDLRTHPEPVVTVPRTRGLLARHSGDDLSPHPKGALLAFNLPGGEIRIAVEAARAYGKPTGA